MRPTMTTAGKACPALFQRAHLECQGVPDLTGGHVMHSVEVDDPDREFLALDLPRRSQHRHDDPGRRKSRSGELESHDLLR